MSALDTLLGFTRLDGGGLSEPVSARKVTLGTGFSVDWDPSSELAVINATAVEPVIEASLIEDLIADEGIGTVGGYISEWRGLRGHVARPINKTMTTDTTTLSGGRRAVLFNGTSHGMTLELPELRRNCASLIFVAHVRAGSAVTTRQEIVSLQKDAEAADPRHVLSVNYTGGGSTTVAYGHWNNDSTLASAARPGVSYYDTEHVIEGICDRYGALIHVFVDGVRSNPEGAAQIDTLSPQPTNTTLSIGCMLSASGASNFFGGVIRRVQIYGYTQSAQLAVNAAARSAVLLGH